MSVTVQLRSVRPSATAVVRGKTTLAEFPKLWRPMLDEVWTFLRGGAPPGLYRGGHNVMLYKDDAINVEVGVQVTGPFEAHGEVVPSALPGGLVAAATHTGPIAGIGTTHAAVRDWAEESGYGLTGQRWEVYGDPDPASGEFGVEVLWALAPR